MWDPLNRWWQKKTATIQQRDFFVRKLCAALRTYSDGMRTGRLDAREIQQQPKSFFYFGHFFFLPLLFCFRVLGLFDFISYSSRILWFFHHPLPYRPVISYRFMFREEKIDAENISSPNLKARWRLASDADVQISFLSHPTVISYYIIRYLKKLFFIFISFRFALSNCSPINKLESLVVNWITNIMWRFPKSPAWQQRITCSCVKAKKKHTQPSLLLTKKKQRKRNIGIVPFVCHILEMVWHYFVVFIYLYRSRLGALSLDPNGIASRWSRRRRD